MLIKLFISRSPCKICIHAHYRNSSLIIVILVDSQGWDKIYLNLYKLLFDIAFLNLIMSRFHISSQRIGLLSITCCTIHDFGKKRLEDMAVNVILFLSVYCDNLYAQL